GGCRSRRSTTTRSTRPGGRTPPRPPSLRRRLRDPDAERGGRLLLRRVRLRPRGARRVRRQGLVERVDEQLEDDDRDDDDGEEDEEARDQALSRRSVDLNGDLAPLVEAHSLDIADVPRPPQGRALSSFAILQTQPRGPAGATRNRRRGPRSEKE